MQKSQPVSLTNWEICSTDPKTFTFPIVSAEILIFHFFFFIVCMMSFTDLLMFL